MLITRRAISELSMRSRRGVESESSAGESAERSSQASLLAAMSESDFLETALNAIEDLFLVFDVDGNLVGYNEYTKSITGYSDEDLRMKPLGSYTCPAEDVPKIKEAFGVGLKGEVSKVETLLLCKDGRQVPIEYWVSTLRDRDEVAIGAIVIGRDLTERKRAEDAIKHSEEHFRALTENSADIVQIINSERVIEYISPSVERALGYSPQELVGRKGVEFVHPDDASAIRDALRAIREEGQPSSVVYRVISKNGCCCHWESIGTLLDGQSGNQRFVINSRDITERVRMEAALRIAQFEADNTLDLILRIASDGSVLYANKTARKLLKRTRSEALASHIWEILPQITEHDWADTWARRAELFPSRSEVEFTLADRQRVSLDLSGEILEFEDDQFLVLIGRDVTHRKETEEQLNEANRDLEIFARTVTHDIMAPLSAISIVGESLGMLIESGVGDEEKPMAVEMVDTIRSGVEDAIGLATDMASLSEVRGPGGPVDRVAVGRVVRRVIEQLAPEIAGGKVEIQVDSSLGHILANPTHIYQLFLNLVSNAVKYSDNSGPVIAISAIDGAPEGGHRYVVRDNGPGVAPEIIDRIFEPLFKGESGGTGLGLATVMKIVKLYDGTIAVYNDGGACFEFMLRDATGGVTEG
jgi:PAS domain S-box-containing protein